MMTPYETASAQFKHKNVLIFGLGLLGGASGDARFFCSLGANVRATDQKTESELQTTLTALSDLPLEYSLGGHNQEDIEWADYIVRNPSVPVNHPLLEQARQLHKRIVMRSSLFVELAGIFTIGITGTRGKTTTTTMIYELVKQLSGKNTLLCGNIAGVSDLELLASISDPQNTIAVMELSSWQLQGFSESKISPNVAVLTNLYPDHLNKYPDLAAYYSDKQTILKYQRPSDKAILNQQVPEFHAWADTTPATISWYLSSDIPADVTLAIPGDHNRANAAAALKLASALRYPESESQQIIYHFAGVPYRLQTIASKAEVTYINDTTSTTPVSTIAALHSTTNPIIICGGADKNLPLDDLASGLNQLAKSIILLPGSGTDKLKPLIDPQKLLGEVDSMSAAVSQAAAAAVAGDTILLSPGFASFGLFTNEFDRGNQFNQCVQTLP